MACAISGTRGVPFRGGTSISHTRGAGWRVSCVNGASAPVQVKGTRARLEEADPAGPHRIASLARGRATRSERLARRERASRGTRRSLAANLGPRLAITWPAARAALGRLHPRPLAGRAARATLWESSAGGASPAGRQSRRAALQRRSPRGGSASRGRRARPPRPCLRRPEARGERQPPPPGSCHSSACPPLSTGGRSLEKYFSLFPRLRRRVCRRLLPVARRTRSTVARREPAGLSGCGRADSRAPQGAGKRWLP